MADKKPSLKGLNFASDAVKQEVLDAFQAMYQPVRDAEGVVKHTPEEHVQYHIGNFVRGVVDQWKEQASEATRHADREARKAQLKSDITLEK